MNYVTKEIAEMLKIKISDALRIQDAMERGWFDFSECSTAQLRREAKAQAKMLGITA